jgi:ABC-type Na+ transport system ATPase subunit NatA
MTDKTTEETADEAAPFEDVTLTRRDLMEVGRLTGLTASALEKKADSFEVAFAMQYVASKRAGAIDDGVTFDEFLDQGLDSGN